MKNTILKFAFSTMLAVLLATMTATAQDEFDKGLFMFLDENGATKWVDATELTSTVTTLGTSDSPTWYIARGSISLTSTLSINGDVHLILADNAELSVNVGENDYGCFNFGSLTVYSQSYGNNMGKLTIGSAGTAIFTNGALTINGGFITAQVADDKPAIYGNFTFNGGSLVANKGYYLNGNATIGYNSPDCYVQIRNMSNATVTVKDGQHFVTVDGDIADGEISAEYFNETFGGKILMPCCKVTINNTYTIGVRMGATIDASTIGYAISNVKYANGNDFDISTPVTTDLNLTATLGEPTQYLINYVLGDNATSNANNPSTYTVEDETFSLKAPYRERYAFVGWTYEGQTEPKKDVTIKKGSIGNKTFTAVWKEGNVLYLDADGNRQWADAAALTPETNFGDYPELGEDNQETWYIVRGSISLNSTLYITGNVHLILADNAELSVNVVNDYGCYIRGSMTLYSQSYGDDMGKMTVEGSTGIYINNVLTINGGFVMAQGADDSRPAIYGDFTINGGKLVANTGSVYGNATIGYNSPNDYVQIKQVNNGSVTIKDGQHFVTDDGKVAEGTISADDFNSTFGDKQLQPCYRVTINDTYIVYVRPEETIVSSTIGYTLSDIKYANGDDFDINTPVTSDLNLMATIAPTTYTITYNLASADASNNIGNPGTYTVETETFSLKAPRRDGWIFVGWTYDGQDEPTKDVKIEQGSAGDKTFTAVWKEGAAYLDADGNQQWADATELKMEADFGESTVLGEFDKEIWYIVTGNISLSKGLSILGDVHLILADKAHLNVKDEGNYGFYINGLLTVYSQSYGDDMGTLTIEGGSAAISIEDVLTINGGFVTAKGTNADIYGNLIFNGGKLVANSGGINRGRASIGYNSLNDYVQIKDLYESTVIIKDGNVFTTQNNDIAEGVISASDFNSKFGGKKLTPYGYKVTVNNTYKVVVPPGSNVDLSKIGYIPSNVKDENGNDFDINTPVNSNLSLTADLTPIQYTITYVLGDNSNNEANPGKYTVEDELTLQAPSRINYEFVGWTYEGQSEPITDVTIEKGSIGNKTFTAVWNERVPYLDAEGIQQWVFAADFANALNSVLGEQGKETWYIVKGNISLAEVLKPKGHIHLILADGASLTYKVEGNYDACIIDKDNPLTVYSQSYGDNMGSLTIDGSTNIYDNALTINGGFITLKEKVFRSFSFNGGRLISNEEIHVYGENDATTTIGYNSPNDYVQIAEVITGSITVQEGKRFFTEDNVVVEGTIQSSVFNTNFGGKKLMPHSNKVTINISGEDYIVDVPYGCTLTQPTKEGYSFVNCKKNGVAFDLATPVTTDLALTAEWKPLPATAPTITSDLTDLSLVYGYTDGNTLSVVAEAEEGHTLSYQWYSNTDATNEGGVEIDGETSASYTIPTGKVAGIMEYYYCVVTAKRDDNNATATTASACAMVTVKDKIEELGALTITENQNGKVAVFDGSYRGSEPFKIDEKITGLDHVEFKRTFSSVGEYSTIMLPLALENPERYGTFARFEDVKHEDDKWIVNMVTLETVEAFTPYLFLPNSTEPQFKWNVTELEKTASTSTEYSVTKGDWTFTGVTEVKRWNSDDNSDYGFAGQTSTSTGTYSIGEFIKVGSGAKLSTFRCFLTKKRSSISKAAVELPASLEVRIINAVTEPEIEPIDPNDDGDIKTPVSEINPAKSDVKVWSYDKTIFIEAAPNTTYRIIDAAGRVLKNDITNSTRDEIRLGNTSGIVIVTINGKTFKIKY